MRSLLRQIDHASLWRRVTTTLCVALPLALSAAVSAEEAGTEPAEKGSKRKHYYQSFLGKQPPELTGSEQDWVNQSSRISLRQLHGRVVWLEFNF